MSSRSWLRQQPMPRKARRTDMPPLKEIKIPLWISLGLGALVYCFFYFNYPALPGNSLVHPLGWWGWFDQGEYIKAARALMQGDFSAGKHAYPPLYPAIGSILLPWVPVHPFFFFNLLGLLTFANVFMVFATRYTSQVEAFALLALSVYFNEIIILNFAIPWTSTGTALLYSLTIYRLLQKSKPGRPLASIPVESAKAFLFSGTFSLLAILRPIDAGAAAVFYPAYLYFSFKSLGGATSQVRAKALFFQALALGAGLLIGLGLFLLFNLKVHGHVLGGYYSSALANGYFPFELPRKVFSLVFDANTVFLEPGASLISHFPWLALSIIGAIGCLIWGSAMLKIMAAAICLQFSLYAPYGDLTPVSIWRYYNIHYFKWMFPYLAFFAWLVLRWIFEHASLSTLRETAFRAVVILACAAVLLMPRFSVTPTGPIVLRQVDAENRVAFSSNGDAIDFIDVEGLAGGFNEIFLGDHKLLADGEPMHRVKDFKLVPSPGGVRIFFNQTVHAREFLLTPVGLNFAPGGLRLTASSYRFTLGKPKLIHDIATANH
ncbi:hypothetical protein QTI24_13345 [Variovorax sp. J22P240]|uniref:hypothetical protein n=1 Tax=Variovorax sp. J22P240 TaxID=3053514 RepID=UPI002576923D|nr:hypothetical protein [Variovorax sp. J22P240]MDL9999598.1 hypothetical protein [Variovorax sp. J22P240]